MKILLISEKEYIILQMQDKIQVTSYNNINQDILTNSKKVIAYCKIQRHFYDYCKKRDKKQLYYEYIVERIKD